jgi:hypothetical protein
MMGSKNRVYYALKKIYLKENYRLFFYVHSKMALKTYLHKEDVNMN